MTLNRAQYKDYGKNDDYNRKYKKIQLQIFRSK